MKIVMINICAIVMVIVLVAGREAKINRRHKGTVLRK